MRKALTQAYVRPEQANGRLDAFLRFMRPELSLRAARRLAQGAVLVNGKAARVSLKLRPGDFVELLCEPEAELPIKPILLDYNEDFCFLWKPSGLHTAKLPGLSSSSLEAFLPQLLEKFPEKPRLLQRLDYGTCGIVCAARNADAALRFRVAERSGKCEKLYLALLDGNLRGKRSVAGKIDANGRKKCRVLKEEGERLTQIEPLAWVDAAEFDGVDARGISTIVQCRIGRGCRHQIRAHAASIGYPLAGDGLYGNGGNGRFMLEHYSLAFPGCKISLPPGLSIFAKIWPELYAGLVRATFLS